MISSLNLYSSNTLYISSEINPSITVRKALNIVISIEKNLCIIKYSPTKLIDIKYRSIFLSLFSGIQSLYINNIPISPVSITHILE